MLNFSRLGLKFCRILLHLHDKFQPELKYSPAAKYGNDFLLY